MSKFALCRLTNFSSYLGIVLLVSALPVAKSSGQQTNHKPPNHKLSVVQTAELDNINKQGVEAYSKGDLHAAEHLWTHGLNSAVTSHELGYIARFLNDLGIVCSNLGQNDKALDYYIRALAIREKLGKQADVADVLNNLGTVSLDLGKYNISLEYYRRAIAIEEKIGDRVDIAQTLDNIAGVYYDLGHYDKALDNYNLALDTFKKVGKQADVAHTLNNLACVYSDLGQFDKALDYHTLALAIREKIGNQAEIAETLNNLGAVYSSLGQNDKALDHYTRALAIKTIIGNPIDIALTLNNMGGVYLDLGQDDKALDYYIRALEIREKNGKPAELAESLNNLGVIYSHFGQYDKSLNYYTRALAIKEKIGNGVNIARTLNNLGTIYGAQARYDKAIEYYIRACAILQKIGNPADIAYSLDNQGRAYCELGRLDDAEKRYAESRRLQELVTLQVSDPSQVGALQETYYHFYERYALLRLKRNLPEEALEMLEAGRGQGLTRQIDLTERGDITRLFSEQEKAELLEKTRLLRDGEVQLRKAQQQAESATGADRDARTKQVELAVETAKKAEREYDQFRDGLFARNPQLRKIAYNQPAEFPRLKTLTTDHPDTLYLEWGIVDEDTTLLFALGDRNGLKPLKLPVGEKRLREIAQRWRESLGDTGERGPALASQGGQVKAAGDERALARQAFDALLGEAWSAGLMAPGRYKRLVFVGSGPLLEMPLAAMIDPNGKRLIESYSVSHAFSLSSLFYHTGVERPTQTFFCIADPTGPKEQPQPVTEKPAVEVTVRSAFRAGFLPLPGARDEGKAVSALFAGSELLIGPEAREQRVTDDMKEFQILHFATHGYLQPNAIQSSGLVLSEEPAETVTTNSSNSFDGLLTVRKIVNLSAVWKRPMAAQLTVLSACETGRGVVQGGEGLMGLAWAFRAAGCPALVVSQWAVDDTATKEWMLTFYGALKAGKPKDDAVQDAMLSVKKDHPSPFYWAAFELIGDVSPISLR